MRIRNGLRVLWRRPGESQVGVDERRAVVLTGLSLPEQQWLDHLERERSHDQLLVAARRLGVVQGRVRELLAELSGHGLLAHRPVEPTHERNGLAAEDDYWQRWSGGGSPVLPRRTAAVAAVLGLDRVGMTLAAALAAAGVGTVLVADRTPVRRDEVGPGGFSVPDVGHPREERARALLRAEYSHIATSAPPGTRPDLVVMCVQDVADPARLRPLVREDVAHLLVTHEELAVRVGPLVVPGAAACARCVELHRTDDQTCWPALATQLLGSPERGVPASLGLAAAAVALTETLAFLDGRRVTTLGAGLVLDGAHSVPRRVTWSVHPGCGCGDLAADRPAPSAAGHPGRAEDPAPVALGEGAAAS